MAQPGLQPTASQQPPASGSSPPSRKVSRRALWVGLALVPFNVYWVIVAELRFYVILTLNPLFVTPIFYLCVLAAGNALLRRLSPRRAFSPGELVIIYVMLVMSCTIATHDFIINLMSSLGWTAWMATGENRWETVLFPHLPRWLLVWDRQLLEGYFAGNSSLYRPQVLRMWLAPLAFWSLFIFGVGWTMLCMTVLIRRAWVDHTRLSFPIIRLPLAITGGGSLGGTMRSGALWAGFALAAGLGVLNGLHEYYPTLPHFQVRAHWISFPTAPWNAIGAMCYTFYPFAIGLAFLVPLDVSFSCWFFYLFIKAQAVLGSQLGYGNVPDFPFPSEQGIGAWYTFGILLLYSSRHYLRQVVRKALGPQDGSDAGEPMSYRVAFWGLLVGMAVFFVFWWQAGMSPLLALLVMATYLLLSLCITRARAEAGGQHTVWDLEPRNLFRLFDSRMLGPANLAAAAVSHWYWRLNRSHTMPSQLEAFKLAQEHGMSLRSLVVPMLAAIALATVVGMWACLHVCYTEGGLARCQGFAVWTGTESYDWLNMALTQGFEPEARRWGAVLGAAGFTALLASLRSSFPWFPFHPLGYCIGPGLIWLWFPFLLAWLAKLLILRYGGLRVYHRALPFFLGLVLGDYVVAALWSLVSVLWHIPTYQLFH